MLVTLFDYVGRIFIAPFLNKKKPEVIRKILVIRLDHLGDVISATPVFRILRNNYPQAKIVALTSEENKELLEENPFIDSLLYLKNHWFKKHGKRFKLGELLSLRRKIRRESFDIGIDLRGDLRNIILLFLSSIKYRLSYGISGGSFLLNQPVPYNPNLHEVEKNVRLLAALGCRIGNFGLDLHISEEKKKNVKMLLEDLNLINSDRLVCIHPGSGYPSKQWGLEKFVDLARRLIRDGQTKIVLVGDRREEEVGRYFQEIGSVYNFIGKTSLGELAALLERCCLFIGNDSGPSHLAAAVGIPFMVIASGTNEFEHWGAWSVRKIFFRAPQACSPCGLKECPLERHKCMEQISVEQVYQKVDEILRSAENPYAAFFDKG